MRYAAGAAGPWWLWRALTCPQRIVAQISALGEAINAQANLLALPPEPLTPEWFAYVDRRLAAMDPA